MSISKTTTPSIEKPHQTMEEKMNTLRAGVLGSNDGILTVVGVLFSVAAATTNNFTIFIAGLADYRTFWPVPFQWPLANMPPLVLKVTLKRLPLPLNSNA